MASAQVFTTTELLEGILAKLPCRDLLLSQRACQKWKTAIVGSTKLQQALFFLPAGPVVKGYGEDSIAYAMSTRTSVSTAAGTTFHWATSETSAGVTVIENPLMDVIFPATKWSDPPTALRSLLYSGASWQKMLLCQPPVSELTLARFVRSWDAYSRISSRAWDPASLSKPVFVKRSERPAASSGGRVVSQNGLRMSDLARVAEARDPDDDEKTHLLVNYIWHWKREGDAVTAASLPALLNRAEWRDR